MKKLTGIILFLILLLIAPSALAKEKLYTASVSGEVSMHISPDEESYVIIDVPACSKLKLIAKEHIILAYASLEFFITHIFTNGQFAKALKALKRYIAAF